MDHHHKIKPLCSKAWTTVLYFDFQLEDSRLKKKQKTTSLYFFLPKVLLIAHFQ